MADAPELHDWKPLVEELQSRRDTALGMGGPDRIERQRSLGKMTVRERLHLLLDRGSFVEYGLLADHMDPGLAAAGYEHLAADGMVAGIGEIEGRRVAVCAYDFTVMAGSMGAVGERKTAQMREMALRWRIPLVWLLDSAGARIQQSTGSTFAGAGALFREQVTLSGVVPQVAAMLGFPFAARAVGSVLKYTPSSAEVPCQRVVNRWGRLAPIFGWGGPEQQKIELETEGVTVRPDYTVDLEVYQWWPE